MKNPTMMSAHIERSMTHHKDGYNNPEVNVLSSITNPEKQIGNTWFFEKQNYIFLSYISRKPIEK